MAPCRAAGLRADIRASWSFCDASLGNNDLREVAQKPDLITIHQAFFFSWIVELKPLTAECICLLLYSLLLASCCHSYILALMCPSEPSGRKTDHNRNLVASSVKSSQITDDAWPTSTHNRSVKFFSISFISRLSQSRISRQKNHRESSSKITECAPVQTTTLRASPEGWRAECFQNPDWRTRFSL